MGGGFGDLGFCSSGGTSSLFSVVNLVGRGGGGGDGGEGRANTIYIKLTVQKNEFTHQSNLLIDCQWCVPEYTTQLHYSS